MEKNFEKPLSNEEWAKQANLKQLEFVVNSIKQHDVQVWANEMCNIVPKGNKVLEIGCGTGISSLWLAKNGRRATALDYTAESIELVNAAAHELNISLDTVQWDATNELPFGEYAFDYIFQCGLLEHFESKEQIQLLSLWRKNCKHMISMIPNSSSIAYRVGKETMEKNGAWCWGMEQPKSSMRTEFEKAGYKNIREYSIGSEWATKFLPDGHYLKQTINNLLTEGYDLDSMMQGYLLVTMGEN